MKTRIKNLTIVAAVAVALSLAVAQPCMANVPNPTPIDLGVLEDCTMSRSYAVNASGQVVGMSWTPRGPDDGVLPELPFIWSGGVMTQLPLPEGYTGASAESINASGQVAGSCWYYVDPDNPATSEEVYAACVWTLEGGVWTVTLLGVPEPYTLDIPDTGDVDVAFSQGVAYKINDVGQVLVELWASMTGDDWSSTVRCAAIWQDGDWTVLDTSIPEIGAAIPIPLYGSPTMNENGQVLLPMEHYALEEERTLYLWDAGTFTEIAPLLRCANMNNAGQIVGWHYTDTTLTVRENFIYDISTGTLSTSPFLDDGYFLLNINDSGQIVVAYPTEEEWDYSQDPAEHIVTTALGLISLDDYQTDPDSVTSLGFVPGYVNRWSVKINAAGEVSGGGYGDPAFFASIDSGVVLLDSLAGDSTLTTAMNDSGAVVGYSDTPELGGTPPYQYALQHATMWGIPDLTLSVAGIAVNPSDPAPVNTAVSAAASFTDAPEAGSHSATWDWGDGQTSDGTVDEESQTVAGGHSYAQPGVYTVGLTVSSAEGSDSAVYQYVVVYDPAAGFVTGGGWFNSPAGAYADDPSLEGVATFGFVSKYKKDAATPTGNTAFEFASGGLYFHSTSYDWLVVTGSNYAKFKGSGNINGGGDYKFMLWAGDGEPDTFRIRIWEEDEDTGDEIDIYDNGFDQAISGGSIVIHTNKK